MPDGNGKYFWFLELHKPSLQSIYPPRDSHFGLWEGIFCKENRIFYNENSVLQTHCGLCVIPQPVMSQNHDWVGQTIVQEYSDQPDGEVERADSAVDVSWDHVDPGCKHQILYKSSNNWCIWLFFASEDLRLRTSHKINAKADLRTRSGIASEICLFQAIVALQ